MPNWCHNTLTVTGPEAELRAFVEKVKTDEQPLTFTAIVPQPSDEELLKLESYKPCTMCGAVGTLPESEAQAAERGAKWFPWMDPAERAAHFSDEALAAGEDRRCNVCRGSGQERVGQEGWYTWRLGAWGTKWDASFDGPFIALSYEGADLDASVQSQGVQVATQSNSIKRRRGVLTAIYTTKRGDSEVFVDVEELERKGKMVRINVVAIHAQPRVQRVIRAGLPAWIDDDEFEVKWVDDPIPPAVAIYKFDTAWSPPAPVVEVASEQHPALEFMLRYGEPGLGYAGELKCVGGDTVNDTELEVEEVLAAEEMWY